jgi:chromosome segregation ATPase
VEALTLDLDEERARRDEQRSVCEKHLRELQNAETDLFECRQALEESEQKLALALVEIEEKSEVLKQTEEQMLRSKEQAREAEHQMDQAKTQMLVQGRCVFNICTNIVLITPRQVCR